tara:strand:- start:149 stop:364 length:216 start_codon:yes stop_codon:yes gene_type:complete
MDIYLCIKLVHILSATVLFGTGMGTAFFMLKAYDDLDNWIAGDSPDGGTITYTYDEVGIGLLSSNRATFRG